LPYFFLSGAYLKSFQCAPANREVCRFLPPFRSGFFILPNHLFIVNTLFNLFFIFPHAFFSDACGGFRGSFRTAFGVGRPGNNHISETVTSRLFRSRLRRGSPLNHDRLRKSTGISYQAFFLPAIASASFFKGGMPLNHVCLRKSTGISCQAFFPPAVAFPLLFQERGT